MNRTAILVLAGAVSSMAYVPNPIDGPQLHRADYGSIQFLVSNRIAAGMMNAAGKVWITPDSVPMDAINSAISEWNGISTTAIHFAPLQATGATYQSADGVNIIVFDDDAYTQATTEGAIAFTVVSYHTNDPGPILDSDIFFSPVVQFSSNQTPGTYDIQSALAHELGHAIGANHTNILSATMYFATAIQDAHARELSADDIAFVSALYPPPGGSGYGTISGLTTVAGAPLLGGALTAIDPNSGITVGGFSSVNDGSFTLQAPPGNYYLYVEPVVNLNLYLHSPQTTVVFTSFQAAFAGGNSEPSLLAVQAGATVNANLNAAAGVSPLKAPLATIAIAGAIGDYHGSVSTRSLNISSGQSVDYLFANPLSASITEDNIQVLGPAILRPGSLRRDPTIGLPDGTQVFRFTLDIPPLSATSSATLVIRSGTDILTRSGLFNLTRPQSVNAASFAGGPVAPGEILSFFGSQLGPPSPSSNGGFDSSGALPTSLSGITATFDQAQAPLFYVSSSQVNLQVPYEVAGQTSTLLTMSYNGNPVATTTLSVANSAPGIFVVTNADGSVNGSNSPSPPGGVLVIYGTGAGLTSGLPRTGVAAPANSTIPATVTLGGRAVTPVYSGLTAGSVGLAQVNIAIPADTPPGNAIPLQFSMNGVGTQTVNVAVR